MSRCLKPCRGCVGMACAASRAREAIVCDSDFQIVDGMSVFTPYYQNESLAVEALGAEVRPHPEIKREACLLAAPTDEATCAAYTSD
jgi:hypothetical protein